MSIRSIIALILLATLSAIASAQAPKPDRRAIIERVKKDLTGLPPTPEEIDEFVNDSSPDANERLVDRLLARHWLDMARANDDPKLTRNQWQYREYVVNALNKENPIDEFVKQRLAESEIPGEPEEPLVETPAPWIDPVVRNVALAASCLIVASALLVWYSRRRGRAG